MIAALHAAACIWMGGDVCVAARERAGSETSVEDC